MTIVSVTGAEQPRDGGAICPSMDAGLLDGTSGPVGSWRQRARGCSAGGGELSGHRAIREK